MEELFLPDHPELAELFLTFLLPGHAAQVGKFMEHFMLTNMNNFINKLNIFFNKQPAQVNEYFQISDNVLFSIYFYLDSKDLGLPSRTIE